ARSGRACGLLSVRKSCACGLHFQGRRLVVTRATAGAPAAGVLLFDRDRRACGCTEGARKWLKDAVVGGLIDDLVAQEREGVQRATSRVTFPSDKLWLAAQAMRLEDGRIVVSVGPAPANHVVELLSCRYGLTGRETEIVDLLARGLDTRAVTR